MAHSAKLKGVDLLGTGDFTHPLWFKTLARQLSPLGNGFYGCDDTLFVITTEVSAIWRQDGTVRKVHLIVLAPSLKAAAAIGRELAGVGKLASDGRPTLKASAQDLVGTIISASDKAMVIPAHVWTPWFSVFGSNSGFDSIDECFGVCSSSICAIETGLSSDPPMNRRISALDRFVLVSNSDAHSPRTIGREATLFELSELTYSCLISALGRRGPSRVRGTLEFYPEEGKYYYDGHRKCGVVLSPKEAIEMGNRCPVCGKPLTIGVMHRIESLADRNESGGGSDIPRYTHLLPLTEIIAQALGVRSTAKGVAREYDRLVGYFGSELRLLLEVPIAELKETVPRRICEGIVRVRDEDLFIQPGYDGVYGEVTIPFKEPGDGNVAIS